MFEEDGAVTPLRPHDSGFPDGDSCGRAAGAFRRIEAVVSDESKKVRGRHEVQDERFW
jgi:hypothetical protein